MPLILFWCCSSLMQPIILASDTKSPFEASMDCLLFLLACSSLAPPSRIKYSRSISFWSPASLGLTYLEGWEKYVQS